ncbi:glycoside hydrolase family 32 protein [Enterococcus devriesei]|uniref:glycoside hydrolase family 32 protein n=1 Tax=Enterococcus devriesei TaxID=319970 RepID=UPI0036D2267A
MEQITQKYYRHQSIPHSIVANAQKKTKKSPFRQQYHIEPETGYLNDPNGFCFFDGSYHLFYQWSPYRYSEENIWYQGWYHLRSKDLVSWKSLGPGIEPDTIFETHGSYSGSGIVVDKELLLFYTGNTRNHINERIPYQMIASMNSSGTIRKRNQAEIVGTIPGYTDHFRDPKIWQGNDGYYSIIGAQRSDRTGTALLFFSTDTFDWHLLGELETHLKEFGYMWECPDYFEMADQGVFIFSPQGLPADGDHFNNLYQSGYLIGEKLAKDQLSLKSHSTFTELDKGFDFYAPQSTTTPDGRRVLIGWMGMPETDYPTEEYGYCGCLTIPRELSIQGSRLIQQPVKEMREYRQTKRKITQQQLATGTLVDSTYEIKLSLKNLTCQSFYIDLCCNENKSEYVRISYDPTDKKIRLDRSHSGLVTGKNFGTSRVLLSDVKDEVELNIFVDVTSVEVFLNQGQAVGSCRVFPSSEQSFISGYIHENSINYFDYWRIDLNPQKS